LASRARNDSNRRPAGEHPAGLFDLAMTTEVYPASPRADLIGGLVWIALGSLIVVMSWQMDRLEQQGASIHTAPGLWPGIVGLVLAALGGVLAVRSIRRARRTGWSAGEPEEAELASRSSFALAVGLFFVYALLLVGRGLPFWLGTTLFVSVFVFLFQYAARNAAGTLLRGAIVAIVCGAATALAVTLVFEQLFLVRLP